MRTLAELQERLKHYHGVKTLYTDAGHIVWRMSTGDNIEVLFIHTLPGHGMDLYRRMVDSILESGPLPYHSVFSFVLGSNEIALNFYHKFGWSQIDLGRSIYRDDQTTLVWIDWERLVKCIKER